MERSDFKIHDSPDAADTANDDEITFHGDEGELMNFRTEG